MPPSHSPAPEGTRTFREAQEAAVAVERQLARLPDVLRLLVRDRALRSRPGFVTLARGSSDHAATYAKYLIETRLGVLVSSAAPSVSSVYAMHAHLRDTVLLAISQSGRSPDLLATLRAAREAGACTVALVNDEHSPLAASAHYVVPLCAGPETGVAATKSFIASLSAIAQLAAHWTGDAALLRAIDELPALLRQAWELDWSAAVERLAGEKSLYVVGRGLGLGVAQEAALKLKETCGQHAEAFSSAELRHGPLALIASGFPVLVLAQADATLADVQSLVHELVARGAAVLAAGLPDGEGHALPFVPAVPELQPLLHAQAFYRMVNALALARGRDPDRPAHLTKVTETL
jgi:glucosamine--fructose-6-phosphate aminotransferase (isomerizing)